MTPINAVEHYKNERRPYVQSLTQTWRNSDELMKLAGEIVFRAVRDEVQLANDELNPINIKRDLNIELRDIVEKFRDEITLGIYYAKIVDVYDKLIDQSAYTKQLTDALAATEEQ